MARSLTFRLNWTAGSLPTTHKSQGSDMGLFGGLLGWNADDERLPHSPQALASAGIRTRIETVDAGDPHPNTNRLQLRNPRKTHSLIAFYTAVGMMEVLSIDGVPVQMDGVYHGTLIWTPKGPVPDFEADAVILHDPGDRQLIQVKASHFASPVDTPVQALKRLAPVLPVPTREDLFVPFSSCAGMLLHDGTKHTPLW